MNRSEFILSSKRGPQEELLDLLLRGVEQPVIMDIGACEGESSVRYSRQFEGARVLTFEPVPSNFARVQQNIEQYKCANIESFQLCLSDNEGTAEFHVSSGNPSNGSGRQDWEYGNKSSSLLAPDKTLDAFPWLQFNETITVPTARLDAFCAKQGIRQIDFVHMDVQGAELMVLQGAGDFLRSINSVWLEVENVTLYRNQPVKRDVEEFFIPRGYVKLLDTVGELAGDQFWAREEYVRDRLGAEWNSVLAPLHAKLARRRAVEGFVQHLRSKIALRSRFRKLLANLGTFPNK